MTPQLLNCKQLALAMGRHPVYISAMKSAGYVMRYGTRDTFANALAWLEQNKDFRSTEYHRRRPLVQRRK